MSHVAYEVARCIVSSLLIESAAYPKPGLVDRVRGLREISLYNMMLSASSLYPFYVRAAAAGSRRGASRGLIGSCISEAAREMLRVQRGGNTHLGALILTVPIAYAAGRLAGRGRIRSRALRRELREVVAGMDWRDASGILGAIAEVSPGGLMSVPYLDVRRRETYSEIRKRKSRVIDVFRLYAGRDMIMDEVVEGYPLTFEVCLPALRRGLDASRSLEVACVNALLSVMSRRPDTHIAKTRGLQEARIVMSMAERTAEAGGAATKRGAGMLSSMDSYMRRAGLRPGSSADILCAALSVHLLEGSVF